MNAASSAGWQDGSASSGLVGLTRPSTRRHPTLPDALPVIGRSSKHPSVVYNFGHQHVGLTLGAVTGKLVQQIIDREQPIVDPTPYRAQRFLE